MQNSNSNSNKNSQYYEEEYKSLALEEMQKRLMNDKVHTRFENLKEKQIKRLMKIGAMEEEEEVLK